MRLTAAVLLSSLSETCSLVILSLPLYFLVLTCYLLPFAVVEGAIEAETDFPSVIEGFTVFEVLTILDVTTAPITY